MEAAKAEFAELLGIYSAIKHFRNFVEGHPFIIYTDHKPLCTMLSSQKERSPRQTRYLSFISEFSSDIRHVKGTDNVVAGALSRIDVISSQIETEELAREQKKSPEVASYVGNQHSNLEVTRIQCGPHELEVDVSTGRSRPIVPLSMRKRVLTFITGWRMQAPGLLREPF